MWILSDMCNTICAQQKLRYKNKQNASKTLQFSSDFVLRHCEIGRAKDL